MPEDLDEYHGEQTLVRPVPTEVARRALEQFRATGRRRRGQISESWWQRGGLLHDDRGPALIDADGERIPLGPFPPGSLLVQVHTSGANTGMSVDLLEIVGPPPERHNLVLLPRHAGLEDAPGLQAWAAASGLEYGFFGGSERAPGHGRARQELGDGVTQDREQREWEAGQPRGLRRLLPGARRRSSRAGNTG